MAYKPSAQLPVTGPDDPNSPWPNQLQQPIQMRRTIDASKEFFDYMQNADAIGDAIVNYYSATIGNFVNTQRRDYGAGIVQQHSKFLNMPGLTIQYENHQGQERLSFTAYPESAPTGASSVEINNDGYIFWAHADPNFPDLLNNKPTYQTPYDIFLNGYLIYSGFQVTGKAQGFVIMFGKTALRCHSLIEFDHKTINPFQDGDFGTNKVWGKNAGLVNAVLPTFQPDVKNLVTPDGLNIPPHPDEFLYSLFDWGNDNNPGGLMLEGFVGLNPSYGRWLGEGGIGVAPEMMNGVQFAFPENSPLNTKGPNYLTIMLKAGAVKEENRTVDAVVVEFYDRGKFSGASQTWSYTSGGKDVKYSVNSKPLLWCASTYASGGISNMSMGFDLKPKADASEDNNALLTDLSQPNSSFAQGTFLGLTPQQQAALAAYAASVAAIVVAFSISQAPIIAAATHALAVAEQTLANINFYLMLYSFGLWNQFASSPNPFTFENETGRPNPLTGLQSIDDFIAASTTEPGLWVVTDSQGGFYLTLQAGFKEQEDIVAAATAVYTEAITKQPTLPEVPANAGTPLDKFVWRTVDQGWTFGDWKNLPAS